MTTHNLARSVSNFQQNVMRVGGMVSYLNQIFKFIFLHKCSRTRRYYYYSNIYQSNFNAIINIIIIFTLLL